MSTKLDAAKVLYRRLEAEAADEYTFGDSQLNAVGHYFLREE